MDERPDGVPAQTDAQPQPQPQPQSPQGAYGPPPAPVPAQWYPPTQTGGFFPPPPPAPSGTSGRPGAAGRAVLWAAVGALVASALWAGGVLLLGGDGSPKADLRGYQAKANLCNWVDYSSVKSEYSEGDDNPIHHSLNHEALDESYCSMTLRKYSTSLSSAYLSVTVDLHKKTDPAPEFTAQWSEYTQRSESYDVEKLTGFGDEAYLVSSEPSGSQYVTLAVRDGWMTYEMSWNIYTSSYDDSEKDDVPALSDVTRWLKTDTRGTLEKLRSDGA